MQFTIQSLTNYQHNQKILWHSNFQQQKRPPHYYLQWQEVSYAQNPLIPETKPWILLFGLYRRWTVDVAESRGIGRDGRHEQHEWHLFSIFTPPVSIGTSVQVLRRSCWAASLLSWLAVKALNQLDALTSPGSTFLLPTLVLGWVYERLQSFFVVLVTMVWSAFVCLVLETDRRLVRSFWPSSSSTWHHGAANDAT